MKSVSPELQAHLNGEVAMVAWCWSLARTDGVTLYATEHDQDIAYDGQTYLAAEYPFSGTAIASSADLSVDNLDLEVLLYGLDRDDILAGLYDHAEIRLFLINWADPSMGILKARRGWVGEVSIEDGKIVAEVRGLAQALQQKVGEIVTPDCPCDIGDARCGVNLAPFTVTGSVTAPSDSPYDAFVDTSRGEDDGTWNGGTISWDTGPNAGYAMEVQSFEAATKAMVLFEPMPFPIAAGDAYTLVRGCDKSLMTCRDVFDNVVNFRGFPFVPGEDVLYQAPDYREP